MKTIQALASLSMFFGSVSQALAVDITANTAPVVTGTGVGMTARFQNVGTLDGTSLDVFAEILSYSPAGKPCVFDVVDDDMFFQFRGGTTGMERNATIRWTFFESGTSTPVTIPNFSFTVDDLDNLPTRRESLTTSNATGFELNDPTNVTATLVGSTITATGGIEQNSGDPEGAVKLHFTNTSSVEISYQTIHGSALVSAYHHDGNEEFIFSDPVYTPVPPAPARLYYTYHFTNEETIPVNVGLYDGLPSNVVWDSSFTPVTTNGLMVDVVYSSGDTEATINPLTLPPGTSTLTLATLEVPAGGQIENTATVTLPDGATLEPPVVPEIELPVAGELALFADSEVATYALVVTDKEIEIKDENSAIIGDVAVTAGVKQKGKDGAVTGVYSVHLPADGGPENIDNQPGGGGQPVIPIFQSLSLLKAEALGLSAVASAMPTTQTFAQINSPTVIEATAPDGINVILIEKVDLDGSETLTLNGEAGDYFVLNLRDDFKLKDFASMVLTGGLTGNHIIVNLLPNSGNLELRDQSAAHGFFFAVDQGSSIYLNESAMVTGTVAGRDVKLEKSSRIVHSQFGTGSGGGGGGGFGGDDDDDDDDGDDD